MKQSMNGKRHRHRPSNARPKYNETKHLDHRSRGTLQQLQDKHLLLARDAMGSGDRVLAEHHYQHADHYYRLIQALQETYHYQRQTRIVQDPIVAIEAGQEVPAIEEAAPSQEPRNQQGHEQNSSPEPEVLVASL